MAHIGCVDDEVSFSPDAVEACRSSGEAECRARCDKGDSGACTALALALGKLLQAGSLKENPMREMVAATSVGVVDGRVLLDLAYEEDSRAEVDMNVVMTSGGGLVETQATAEKGTYTRKQLDEMLDVAEVGIRELLAAQKACLEG